MIEHIVCSGAGPNGLVQIGAIVEYEKQGILDFSKLKSFFGCSAGAMLGMMLLFKIPLEEVADYIIKRPWNKFAKVDIFSANEVGGLLHCEKILELFEPLILAYDIPKTITFRQAREKSNLDLHVFCTEFLNLTSVDFTYETAPDMPIMTAVMMSCAIPPMFCGGTYDGKSYIDGGLSNNFPYMALVASSYKPEKGSILGVNMVAPKSSTVVESKGFSLIETVSYIILKLISKNSRYEDNHKAASESCEHYVVSEMKTIISKELWESFLYHEDFRANTFEKGRRLARERLGRGPQTDVVE